MTKEKEIFSSDKFKAPLLSLSERNRRWSEIRKRMDRDGIDALLIWGNNRAGGFGLANLRYVTHVACQDGACLFPLEGEPIVFADSSHVYHPYNYYVKFQNWVRDVRPLSGAQGLIDAIHSAGLTNTRKIGYVDRASLLELYTMPHPSITRLSQEFRSTQFVDATSILDETRMKKSEEEIQFLRHSGEIARSTVAAMISSSKPGSRERDVYAEMAKSMISQGGENCSTSFFLASDSINSPNSFLLHGREGPWCPTGRVLQTGDLIMCELHASYGGYLTQTERTISIGNPPENLRQINDVVMESFEKGLSKMKPGETLRSCAEAFLEPVREAKMDFVELGFHGHGLGSPEFPTCIFPIISDSSSHMRIEPGMVFACNIDIHNPGWRKDVGVMFSDTFVIRDSSSLPERLVNLDPDWTSV